jgi:hypothetical protein
MAQFIRRLVQRVDDAGSQTKQDEHSQQERQGIFGWVYSLTRQSLLSNLSRLKNKQIKRKDRKEAKIAKAFSVILGTFAPLPQGFSIY